MRQGEAMTSAPARSCLLKPASGPAGGAFVRVLLILAAVCLPLGLTLPVLETTRLWVFKDSYSLIDTVRALFDSGEIVLAGLIAVFSLVTPVLKLCTVTLLHAARPLEAGADLLRWAERIGKWSLADVLVIAILIVAGSGAGIQLVVQPGLWFFAASTGLLMAASGLIAADFRRRARAGLVF